MSVRKNISFQMWQFGGIIYVIYSSDSQKWDSHCPIFSFPFLLSRRCFTNSQKTAVWPETGGGFPAHLKSRDFHRTWESHRPRLSLTPLGLEVWLDPQKIYLKHTESQEVFGRLGCCLDHFFRILSEIFVEVLGVLDHGRDLDWILERVQLEFAGMLFGVQPVPAHTLLFTYLEPIAYIPGTCEHHPLFLVVCPFHSKRGSFGFYVHIDMGPVKPQLVFIRFFNQRKQSGMGGPGPETALLG